MCSHLPTVHSPQLTKSPPGRRAVQTRTSAPGVEVSLGKRSAFVSYRPSSSFATSPDEHCLQASFEPEGSPEEPPDHPPIVVNSHQPIGVIRGSQPTDHGCFTAVPPQARAEMAADTAGGLGWLLSGLGRRSLAEFETSSIQAERGAWPRGPIRTATPGDQCTRGSPTGGVRPDATTSESSSSITRAACRGQGGCSAAIERSALPPIR